MTKSTNLKKKGPKNSKTFKDYCKKNEIVFKTE